MDELRSLKQLYEDGFVVESEYNRRRVELINKITGKNFTLEDITKAEQRQQPQQVAAQPAPVQQTPVPQQPPVQQFRQPAVLTPQPQQQQQWQQQPQQNQAFQQNNIQTNSFQSNPLHADISGFDELVLEEIPSEEIEIWDELDALSLQSTAPVVNQADIGTVRAPRVQSPQLNPTGAFTPASVQSNNMNMGTLRAVPASELQPTNAFNPNAIQPAIIGGGLQPTSAFNPNAIQPAAVGGGLQPTSAFNPSAVATGTSAMGTLRQPAVGLQPTNTFNAAGNMSTLRNPAGNVGGAGNAGTLRQPASFQQNANSMYGQQDAGMMMMQGGAMQGGVNALNTMYGNNQMMMQPGQMGMYGAQGYPQEMMMGMQGGANTMYGNQMMGMQGGANTMYGMQGGANTMYGMQGGVNTMYGNQMQMAPGGYGQPDMMMGQMGMQGGLNTMNTTMMASGQMAGGNTMRPQVNNVRSAISDTPSEFRNTPSLESGSMVAKPTSKKLLESLTGKGANDKKEPYTWEFFHAASNNNVKRLNELLELGVFVNQIDLDTGNTALHMAAQKGQKHALFFLVDQGADIDAQNKKGSTPLHMLVQSRFNTLAVWLVKQGADITIEDVRGFTPYDMALSWLQKEMKEAVYGRQRSQKTQQQINRTFGELAEELNPELRQEMQREVNFNKMQDLGVNMDTIRDVKDSKLATTRGAGGMVPPSGGAAPLGAGLAAMESMASGPRPSAGGPVVESAPLEQEVMKIYLKNKSYKSLLITSQTKAGDVCEMMAAKLGMEEFVGSFDLADVQRETTRRLDPQANLFKIKKFWPLILGKNGNETEKHCYFMVIPKRGTSEAVQRKYRKAIS